MVHSIKNLFVFSALIFQNPVKVFGNNENTPPLKPRQISFATKSISDTKFVQTLDSPLLNVTRSDSLDGSEESKSQLKDEIEYLKLSLDDKNKLVDEVTAESRKLKADFDAEKDILLKDIEILRGQIDELQLKIETIEAELVQTTKNYDTKSGDIDSLHEKLNEVRANNGVMQQQLSSMENTIKLKDELITKLQKDNETYNQSEQTNLEALNRLRRENAELANSNGSKDTAECQRLRDELAQVQKFLAEADQELSDKALDYEKLVLDMKEQEEKIFHLTDKLADSKSARSVEELRIEMRTHREENERLKFELSNLKRTISVDRAASGSPIHVNEPEIDEITSRVEKELNYSAQLDSSILKAMEKDNADSDDEIDGGDDIDRMRCENHELAKQIEKLKTSLESERQKFTYIHQQDTNCIEEMTKRLEAAIENEHEINRLLEDERNKTSKLSTKMLEHQFERAKLSASSLSLNDSPISSPRRLQKESDQELLKYQNDEIKLLKSQLEREKERAVDIDKSLAREKNRFEKELTEQKAYGERMRDELERIIRENKQLQQELDDAQER